MVSEPISEEVISQWRMRILGCGMIGSSESISDVLRDFAREILKGKVDHCCEDWTYRGVPCPHDTDTKKENPE